MVLKYKGCTGSIQWDKDSQDFYGEILNIPDTIVYSGRNLTEIKETFHEAVDEYLVDAKQRAIFDRYRLMEKQGLGFIISVRKTHYL